MVDWCGVNQMLIHFSKESIRPSIQSSIHPFLPIILALNGFVRHGIESIPSSSQQRRPLPSVWILFYGEETCRDKKNILLCYRPTENLHKNVLQKSSFARKTWAKNWGFFSIQRCYRTSACCGVQPIFLSAPALGSNCNSMHKLLKNLPQ